MFALNLQGIRDSITRLEKFRTRMVPIAADEIVKQVHELTALSTAPDGSQYPALSKAYAKRKSKTGQPAVPNYRFTGKSMATVLNRSGIIAPEDTRIPQFQGLAKTRPAFEVAPNTVTIIEAQLLKEWNATA